MLTTVSNAAKKFRFDGSPSIMEWSGGRKNLGAAERDNAGEKRKSRKCHGYSISLMWLTRNDARILFTLLL